MSQYLDLLPGMPQTNPTPGTTEDSNFDGLWNQKANETTETLQRLLDNTAAAFLNLALQEIKTQIYNGNDVINNPLKVGILSDLGFDVSSGKIPAFFNAIFGENDTLPSLQIATAFGLSEQQFQEIPAQAERLNAENTAFTSDQLVDRFNNARASQDFGLSATFDPSTGKFIVDLSSFGFTGSAATKEYTPQQFLNELGLQGSFDGTTSDQPTNAIGEIAGSLTDAQVIDEQNKVIQQVLDELNQNGEDGMVKRPELTGNQQVDDLINVLWGDFDYRGVRSIIGLPDFAGWLEDNRPGDHSVIYDQTNTNQTQTNVDQLPGSGVQINPDGSVTSTSSTGVNNDPVTNPAGSGADTTNNPAGSGTNTGGTGMWPENPVEGQTHTNNGRKYIYRNGQWVLDTPDDGGVFRSGDVVRMPDGTIYTVDMGPNGPIYTPVSDIEGGLPEGTPINWDFQQDNLVEGSDDGTGDLVNFLLGLFGLGSEGGGGMSQDQKQVLVNEIKDLLDVTIGDQTATVGDTSATVGDTSATVGDQSTVVDASSTVDIGDQTTEVDIGDTDIDVAGSTVEVGDQTQTIEEGAFDVEGGAGGSATIEEGAFDVTGGAGGAGGQGGTGGSVGDTTTGDVTSTVNVDTSGFGDAIGSLGDAIGGTVGNVMNVLGTILGGQSDATTTASENSLAGILAQEAGNRYIADKMAESQANVLAFQKDQYDDAIGRLQPFYDMGVTQAEEVLPDFIEAAKRDIEYTDIDPFNVDDPTLRFLQDEMRRQTEASAAGRGRLNTGGTLTELQDRAANIALARSGELVDMNQRLSNEQRMRDEYDFQKPEEEPKETSLYGMAHQVGEVLNPPGQGPSIRADLGSWKELGLDEKQFSRVPTLESYEKSIGKEDKPESWEGVAQWLSKSLDEII